MQREYDTCLVCGKLRRADDISAPAMRLSYGLIICDWMCENKYWKRTPVNLEIRTGFSYLYGQYEKRKYPQPHYFNKPAEIVFYWNEDEKFLSIGIIDYSRIIHNCYTKK